MVQPDTVSQSPVARHLTVSGSTVPSYPVAHATVAVASYVVSVNVYVYPVATGSLQSEMKALLLEKRLLLCRLSCEIQIYSLITFQDLTKNCYFLWYSQTRYPRHQWPDI